MSSTDRFSRPRRGRPIGKPQTLEIEGGGYGFVLVDLDTPHPRPDPVWLKEQLALREVECEFPRCEDLAVTFVVLQNPWVPFVCKLHELACTHHIASFRIQAVRTIADAMLDEILLTNFDKPRRWENPPNIGARMNLPLAPAGRPSRSTTLRVGEPKASKPATITTFNRPKLGQN